MRPPSIDSDKTMDVRPCAMTSLKAPYLAIRVACSIVVRWHTQTSRHLLLLALHAFSNSGSLKKIEPDLSRGTYPARQGLALAARTELHTFACSCRHTRDRTWLIVNAPFFKDGGRTWGTGDRGCFKMNS